MPNPYDALAASLQPQDQTADANPYDTLLDDLAVREQQRARTVFEKSLASNPDQAAESVRLAKQTGLPADTVERNLDEVRRKEQARLLDLQRLAAESPVLARQLADPTFTKQAHDDVERLAAVERTFAGTAGDVAVTALKGAVGLPQSIVGIADLVTGGYAGKGAEALGIRFAETQQILDSLYSPAQQAANRRVEDADGFLGTLAAMLQSPSTIATSVGESLPQMIGGAAAGRALVSAAPRVAPWIAAAFGEGTLAAGAAAEQFRSESDDGLLGVKETFAALGTGAGTALFGMVGGRAAQRMGLGDIDTALVAKGLDVESAGLLKQGFIASVLKAGISEGVFEELPQSMQEQMWQNYVANRPLGQGVGKAAAQGLLAGFSMGGGFQAIGRIGDHFGAAQEAHDRGQQLQAAMQTAAQSMLRQRNPEEFRALMQRMAENTEGAPQEVYLDAEVLNQLPQDVLQALPEGVLAQLEAAIVANDVVAIPVADVLTIAPGTALEQALVENARIGDPMAMTQAEAKVAGEQAQQYLAQEAERVIAQANDAQALQASSDNVKQGLLDQLNTVGRFSPAVNESYATWTTAFYTTMAGRLGISPEEMAGKYPLRIGAQGADGSVLLGQGATLADVTAQWDAAGIKNAVSERNGTITLSQIVVPQEARGAGQGSAAMQALVDYADRTGQRVVLSPSSDFGGSKKRLVEFYKRFGFVENKGRNKDFTTMESMIRAPQTLAQSNPQTETPEFKAWFGDSKVVDASGKPLVVYHGTGADISEFTIPEAKHGQVFGKGIYFTSSTKYADSFAYGEQPNIIPTFVSLQNPLIVETGTPEFKRAFPADATGEQITAALEAAGHDGIIMRSGKTIEVVAFRPEQIKSAIGNRGTFDPNDPNILNQGPRATFNPQTLELVLNENADLSSFLHETGHFFLEVMADLSSQPDAPAEIQQDMAALLKWFGIKGDENVGGPDAGGSSELAQKVDQTQTPEFKNWFGESKVVDASGKPLVVYHGTPEESFEIFDIPYGGTYFAEDAAVSEFFATDSGGTYNGANAFYLKAESIFDAAAPEADEVLDRIEQDYDNGTDYKDPDDGEYMPLRQWVKSGYLFKLGRSAQNEVMEALRAEGYDGVRYVDASPATGDSISIVVFDPTQIKSATDNRGTFDPNDPSILAQDGNLPTDSTQPVRRTPLETWNAMTLDQKRKYHERFAESMEQYLLEGKAPSLELAPLFRKFKRWMEKVYTDLKAFIAGHPDSGIVLSDEIRQVFDRMLASREQIAQAEEVAGLVPDENATEEAVERLTARSLRDLKWTVNARAKAIKALQKQAAELRKGVEAEVRAEVEAMPVYRAMRWLKKGETTSEAGEQIKAEKGFRLNTGALAEMFPETMLARPDLTRLKGMTGKDGLHPDMVADMFGFDSGEALVRSLIDAEPIASVIEGMTDQRMLERHGDLVDDRAIAEAANEAVHNEARARALATELKAQADMLGARQDTGRTNAAGRPVTVSVIAEAAKQFAANVVGSTAVRDLKARAWQHVAAERRAGKRWQEATAKGQTQDAVKAKQDQVLNNAAAKAATEAQAEVRKITDFFARVVKGNNEKVVEKGRDPDVVNAARAILAAYGMAPRAGKTALEYLEVLQRNDPAMFAALQPSIQGALTMARPLDTLTLDELRSLHDEIQAMWHLAKRSRQMEVDGNLLDIEDAEADLQARMQEIGVPDEVPGEKGAITPREAAQRKLQYARSLLRRVEQWAEGMDGKFGGPFLRLVFQPVKDAADRYRADRVKYRKAYQTLVDQVAPHLRKGEIAAPELGYTFGRGHNGIGHAELLHAILHTGNESNKRKLLLGRKWATENPDGTLDTSRWDAFVARMHNDGMLTKEHYDFAQGVWDLLEQTKALAQKTHRDVFGRYFAEVTADEVVTPFGTYRGGYVPAQADPQLVQDAEIRKLAEAENESMAYAFPSTNRGFTKGRVEYNRPLVLDLRSIGQHLDKVLLFSHMEAHVRDVQKLLSRKGVSYSLSRIDPTAYAGMLTPWLSRSARQVVETPVTGDGGLNRILTAARNRAGMALMFANVSNTLQQITGFSTAAIKVKPALIMKSVAQFIAHPKQTAKTVADASPFMANRMENEVSAINDAIDQILLDPNIYERAQSWTQKHAYFLQTAMANTMEPIIWTAAYNQAVEQGQDEHNAARFADNVIRTTQGSTLPEDVSRIETGPAYARAFTQFVGYFNMMANTNGTALKQIAAELGIRKGAGKMLYVVTLGLLAPLWVAEALALAMRGGPDDEDDDGYLDDWLAAVFGMGTIKGTLAMVPFAGQLGNAAINRMNNNPADDRVSLSPAVSLLEAAAGVPSDVYKLVTDPEKLNARNAVRDVASLISITTGLPAYAVARPAGYLAGVADGRIDPTGAGDAVRGAVTGVPSPDSR